MTTPQISGKYQFQVDLKGCRLPITFTVPDIPDAPSEEQFDPGHSIEETSDSLTQRAEPDPLGSVNVEIDQPNLLHVSAYIPCTCTTGLCMSVDSGNWHSREDNSWKRDKVPVAPFTGETHTFGRSFQYSGDGQTPTTITTASL